MLATSLLTTFGMGVHAGGAMAPTAFFPETHRMSWLYVCMAAWMVQWAPACLWPTENRRRWKTLDTVCRDETEGARAALPDSTRQAIVRSKEAPKPPPPLPQPTRHRTRSHSPPATAPAATAVTQAAPASTSTRAAVTAVAVVVVGAGESESAGPRGPSRT